MKTASPAVFYLLAEVDEQKGRYGYQKISAAGPVLAGPGTGQRWGWRRERGRDRISENLPAEQLALAWKTRRFPAV